MKLWRKLFDLPAEFNKKNLPVSVKSGRPTKLTDLKNYPLQRKPGKVNYMLSH